MTDLSTHSNPSWIVSGAKWFGVNLLYYLAVMVLSAAAFFAFATVYAYFYAPAPTPPPSAGSVQQQNNPEAAPSTGPAKERLMPAAPPTSTDLQRIPTPMSKLDQKDLIGEKLFDSRGKLVGQVVNIVKDNQGTVTSVQVNNPETQVVKNLPASSVVTSIPGGGFMIYTPSKRGSGGLLESSPAE
jgi:sporulation protein YlmC with PRC-barrel domain